MSFCIKPSVCEKCGKPLTLFEGRYCLECEKAEQEPKYCERNICLKNEYNGIGCDECEVGRITEREQKGMSEYVKIKRRLYDELIETRAKYIVLCNMLESMTKVYEENKIKVKSEDKE